MGELHLLGAKTPPAAPSTSPPSRSMVAVVIEWRGKVALFKRSRDSDHRGGLWDCPTACLGPGASTPEHAVHELLEEAGLHETSLIGLHAGPAIVIEDSDAQPLRVHTFRASSSQRRLEINREHYESYRWTARAKVRRFVNRAGWVERVVQATNSAPDCP